MFFKSKKERRRHFRVEPEASDPIIVHINGADFFDIVYASDISEGGSCIVVPHEFEGCKLDGDISVVITLPRPINRSILASGAIRHIGDKRFGVSFIDVSREDRKQIRRYISCRIQDRSPIIRLMHKFRII